MSTTLLALSNTKIKMRYGETYTSEGLNKQFFGVAAGIGAGFVTSFPSALNIRFSPDSTLGYHFARVRLNGGLSLSYIDSDTLTFDLASVAGSTVYIGLNISFSTAPGTTTGTFKAYTQSEYDAAPAGVLWICKVAVPGSGTLAESHVDTSCRARSSFDLIQQSVDTYPWSPAVADPLLATVSSIGTGDVEVTGDAECTISTSHVSQARRSVGVSLGASAGDAYRRMNGMVACVPGKKVRVMFGLKAVGATVGSAGVRLRFRQGNFTYVSSLDAGKALTATTADFMTYQFEVTVPANCWYADILVGATNLSVGSVYIEAVQVWGEQTSVGGLGRRGSSVPMVYTPHLKIVSWNDTGTFAAVDFDDDTTLRLKIPDGGVLQVGDETDAVDLTVYGDIGFGAAKTRYMRWHGGGLKGYFTSLNTSSDPSPRSSDLIYYDLGSGKLKIGTCMIGGADVELATALATIPLHLPHGAVLKNVSIYASKDSDTLTVTASVWRHNAEGITNSLIGSAATIADGSTSMQNGTASLADAVVDNSTTNAYALLISVAQDGGDITQNNVAIRSVSLEYEVTTLAG